MRFSLRSFIPLLAVIAATACSDATSAPASETTTLAATPVVASITLTSGNDQFGLVGANLSVPICTKVITTTGARASSRCST